MPNELTKNPILLLWIIAQEQIQQLKEKVLEPGGLVRILGFTTYQLCHSWTSDLPLEVLVLHPEKGELHYYLTFRVIGRIK